MSIVSHGHGDMIRLLLQDLTRYRMDGVRIVLTCNVPEAEVWREALAGFDHHVIRNSAPKGFGANHNAAFRLGCDSSFLVLNPDIRLPPEFDLLEAVRKVGVLAAGVCAPQVRSSSGQIEDSARRFPTVTRLLRRHFMGQANGDYPPAIEPFAVEWVAGMFMLFDRDAYEAVNGFDERYFLYLEDADICRRLWRSGYRVVYDPTSHVIHDAQRASRRNLRHLSWHVSGMLRFLTTS